jgi:hypothetical protein
VTLISDSEVKDLGPINPMAEPAIQLPESRSLAALGELAAPQIYRSVVTIGTGLHLPSEPGVYQLQFFLRVDGQKLPSDVLRLTIEKPKGADRKALRFLELVKGDTSFEWVWKKGDGVATLRNFIEEFRDTPYADYAVLYLGNVLLARNDLAGAQEQFDKLKGKGNSYLSEQAEKFSGEVAKRKIREPSAREQ